LRKLCFYRSQDRAFFYVFFVVKYKIEAYRFFLKTAKKNKIGHFLVYISTQKLLINMKTIVLIFALFGFFGANAQNYKHPFAPKKEASQVLTFKGTQNNYKTNTTQVDTKAVTFVIGAKALSYKHPTIPKVSETELLKFIKTIRRGSIYGI